MVWESKFFQKQINYNWTPDPYLGENISLSVVASEDSSFCDHIGIDINEIYKVIKGGELVDVFSLLANQKMPLVGNSRHSGDVNCILTG